MFPKLSRQTIQFFLIAIFITGCGSNPTIQTVTPLPIPPTSLILPTPTFAQLSPTPDVAKYAFPNSIDPTKHYMFYLHGKIIEDQGIPAVSPEYGEYEYHEILEKLEGDGFIVISEPREKNTDGIAYARQIIEQITSIMDAEVPAKNITVVGASKGAWITIYVSHLLGNEQVNFVIMAICDPENLEAFKQDQITLSGNILSIYDSADALAGSCQELFSISEGKGISKYEELILNTGSGHGVLYQPLDEWIIPVVQWAGKP
jgi:hypothetical protein